MEGLKFTISVDDSKIFIDEIDSISGRIVRQFLDAKDEKVKDLLCATGWTPPEEKAKKERDEIDDLLEESVQQKVRAKQPLATFPCLGGGTVKMFAGKRPPLYEPPVNKLIHEAFRTLTHAVHANAVEHGWWEEDRGTEPLLLMHTEISEAVEALREGNPESKKIPGHSHVAEELADVVIRVLDYCGKHNINIGAAITAKHEFNRSRPYRHGGKAF